MAASRQLDHRVRDWRVRSGRMIAQKEHGVSPNEAGTHAVAWLVRGPGNLSTYDVRGGRGVARRRGSRAEVSHAEARVKVLLR